MCELRVQHRLDRKTRTYHGVSQRFLPIHTGGATTTGPDATHPSTIFQNLGGGPAGGQEGGSCWGSGGGVARGQGGVQLGLRGGGG